ncbi:MAG: DMT family transporter [Deltaproteobacteria bacterium]
MPFLLFLAVLGGVALAVQAPLNAALARSISSPVAAAAVSFGGGFIILLILTLVSSGGQPFAALLKAPLWQIAGGALGALYVWAIISAVPTLGVVTAIAALILGQVTTALVLDAIGAFGLTVQAITWQRLLAIGLVTAGLVLSRA